MSKAAALGPAQPRWSHRDPVEGGNPFPPGTPVRTAWAAATDTALDRLREMDARIADTAQVTLDPTVYRTQLFDLAVGRFEIWTERGLAVVSTEDTRLAYERWLDRYLTNWMRYVAETCPRVEALEELTRRLSELAGRRARQARRAGGAPRRHRRRTALAVRSQA